MSRTREAVVTQAEIALAGLKDFQRETVEYVFQRLYARDASRRFLVADEVGLGKTLIAKGVVARAIEHLHDTVPRIDVVYVCSNGDIARQNINRLRVGGSHIAMASRLTLLPLRVEELAKTEDGVNFVAFTPSTSFDVHGGLGHVQERGLLYAMLRDAWDLGNRVGPLNVLQGHASPERFRAHARELNLDSFDRERRSTKAFCDAIAIHDAKRAAEGIPPLRERFAALCESYSTTRSQPSNDVTRQRTQIIGELRTVLAASCIEALEPDLVILDEFQRFNDVLDGEEEGAQLARELFDYKDVAVLLLSATPYKMYTTAGEANDEDHYRDFVRTLRFLENGRADGPALDAVLRAYRRALLNVGEPNGEAQLQEAKNALEARLRKVMVRTERLASTPDRNGMLTQIEAPSGAMKASDIGAFLAVQNVSRAVEHVDTVEFWKSAPYMLNFMDTDYVFKRRFEQAIAEPDRRMSLARTLSTSEVAALDWEAIERYGAIDPANARMRSVLADTVERGAHRLLWIPPSLPYYRLGGAFADPGLAKFTKRLIFSSWRFVPRAIASMVSYEAERRMIGRERAGANTVEARKRRKPLLRFARSDGRLSGMPVLALMYPSVYLARACDPAAVGASLASDKGVSPAEVPIEELLSELKVKIDIALRRLPASPTEGVVDERWYWAAPLLLDRLLEHTATVAWFGQANLAHVWTTGEEEESAVDTEDGDSDVWQEHVAEARAFASDSAEPLGRRPDDLLDVLAQMAVGGPGVTMLRAMLRVVGMTTQGLSSNAGIQIRNGAARGAWYFRTLFNQPEITALLRGELRGDAEHPYWRQALAYCVDGGLQAVLDEYAHVLRDHLGLGGADASERVHQIADQICQALSLRTANIGVDDLGLSEAGRTLRHTKRKMRCHFALRFGDERDDEGEVATRADSVRKAFNSPFWPFVVATTSVGQEGLDFHTYCHAVVHWNVPSNPVDLEQREGRVHRYKNHAVRRNVAGAHGNAALASEVTDLWEEAFETAKRGRGADATDVVPYWVYATEGGARIERHVPALPVSRERGRMRQLAASLAVYRMVFGQPRQDDLLRHLVARSDIDSLRALLTRTAIDLSPR